MSIKYPYKEYNRKWRMKNRKPCRNCGRKMPYPSPGRKYCDECQPLMRKKLEKEHRAKRFAQLAEYKLTRGCDICGYKKCASALHFHHREPHKKEHRVWVPKGDEYDKCDLVCANCHFEIHEDKKLHENGDVY